MPGISPQTPIIGKDNSLSEDSTEDGQFIAISLIKLN